MYKVYIPVMNHKLSEKSKKALVSEIKRSEATAVFLTFKRVFVSASKLEAYDMALRASGKTDSILKYRIDYTLCLDEEIPPYDARIFTVKA